MCRLSLNPNASSDTVQPMRSALPPSRISGNCIWGVCLLVSLGMTPRSAADVFVLKDGGRVEGTLSKPRETDNADYVIQPLEGGSLTLSAARVAKIIPWSKEKKDYLALLPKMPKTADGNWKMAEWCGGKRLRTEREFHLEETIRLDANHALARKALGYVHANGEWVASDELMAARGFVRHQGKWRLAEELTRAQAQDQARQNAVKITKDIRRWRGWLGGKKDAEGWSKLRGIQDPAAVPAVVELLRKETQGEVRRLLVEILGRLATPEALGTLARAAIEADSSELRALCLEQLARHPSPGIRDYFISQLSDAVNLRVRRAGAALAIVGDETAVKPLIQALVTQHKTIVAPANPGQISGAFGSGSNSSGTGFSTGGGAKVAMVSESNREVLDALARLTSVNFQYDRQAWLNWLVQENAKDMPTSLRRGE